MNHAVSLSSVFDQQHLRRGAEEDTDDWRSKLAKALIVSCLEVVDEKHQGKALYHGVLNDSEVVNRMYKLGKLLNDIGKPHITWIP